MRTLLVGYGNPWRRDDGLGLALVRRFPECEHRELQELSLELVDELGEWDVVVFVDASLTGEDYQFREVGRRASRSPFTHQLSPEELCLWAEIVTGRRPRCYLLSIRGYDFDFGEGLSEGAAANLRRAEGFLRSFLAKLGSHEVNAR